MPTSNIENPRVHPLSRQASDATGTSMASVIELVPERLLAEMARPQPGTADRLMALARISGPTLCDIPADLIERSAAVRLSGATALECAIVLGPAREFLLDRFLAAADAQIEPITVAQVSLARAAHRTYERGSGHPARLNSGDCRSHALAKERDEALLFKGSDFIETDIRPAATT